jgi:hypothetical protein
MSPKGGGGGTGPVRRAPVRQVKDVKQSLASNTSSGRLVPSHNPATPTNKDAPAFENRQARRAQRKGRK